jgi:ferredoxin
MLNFIITKKGIFMPITKVWIEDGCICCGMSSDTCPEVFEIPDDHDINVVKENVDFSQYEEEIKEAANGCPVDVIKYEEQD